MVRPPPLIHLPLFPATGATAFFAIAVTLAWWKGHDITPLVDTPAISKGELWRLVTSALPHVNVLHLLYNVMGLWAFGTIVERELGPWRTSALYVFLAAGSSAAEYALFRGGVGLSGVVYGVWGMLYVLSKRDNRFLGMIDSGTNQLMVVWFFLCIVMTATGAMPIANVAHGVGALLGYLVGQAIAAWRNRMAFRVATAATFLLCVVGAVFARPTINLDFPGQSRELTTQGNIALTAGDANGALRLYLKAVDKDPDNAVAWENLGLTYEYLDQKPQADIAFKKAAVLKSNQKPRGRRGPF